MYGSDYCFLIQEEMIFRLEKSYKLCFPHRTPGLQNKKQFFLRFLLQQLGHSETCSGAAAFPYFHKEEDGFIGKTHFIIDPKNAYCQEKNLIVENYLSKKVYELGLMKNLLAEWLRLKMILKTYLLNKSLCYFKIVF